ncbi:MAG: 2-C-methyl-D-erythritol 2,4-cyclodiphosphate synthase [Paramuribaculum sp.]|nr:2-C-methyl-D-erythritol 2,4-cyclodiphosphate synthase [Paramuribaculum sp.]
MFRIGTGFDVHAFAPDRELWLCGVNIPHSLGLAGHSDADVAIHALCDALLGAAALGDIGKHFPDTDPRYKGIDSRLLLRHVIKLLEDNGYMIGNADITIIAQQPRLSPHIEAMRSNLAEDLHTDIGRVSVKATTTEHLGFTGRSEGIAAQAAVLIQRPQL